MNEIDEMQIERLGEARRPSPRRALVGEEVRIPLAIGTAGGPDFELAGPRARLFFDPAAVRAGIVPCGGPCPGLNNVIRSLFMELHHGYGVPEILGFRDGYRGLDPARARPPLRLDPDFVNDIHKAGGTVLGTSRGPVDMAVAVRRLRELGVNVLFCVGGDGTQRGALALHREARRQECPLAVVGVPKTIDNDVAFVSRSFGYQTALEIARGVIDAAHTESKSVDCGISLVKLMGRAAGFIAAGATVASQDVNFTLIPEVPFALDGPGGFLAALQRRLTARRHAVVVVAEGAGADLLPPPGGTDASGNARLADIGPVLKDHIAAHFRAAGVPAVIRYFDPSYLVRSHAADAEDAILCDLFARHAVHAAMSGRTGVLIGHLHDAFIHVPIAALEGRVQRVEPDSNLWRAVLAATGQPERFA